MSEKELPVVGFIVSSRGKLNDADFPVPLMNPGEPEPATVVTNVS